MTARTWGKTSQRRRCPHGLRFSGDCPRCNPLTASELPGALHCALCESFGHVARLCNATKVGRLRRGAHRRRGAE